MAEKYIIGVDGSEESHRALAWGLERAAAHKADVELLYVADDSFLSETPVFVSDAQAAGEKLLKAEAEHARTLGFEGTITGNAIVGNPVGELEKASKRADLIILGAHHGSRLAGTFFGTRAVKIAAAAHCPVAVIPLEKPVRPTKGVVVGVDGSDASVKAVEKAAAEAATLGVPLHAIYAWMTPLTPGIEFLWSPELIQEQEEKAQEALAIGTAGVKERFPDLEIVREVVQAPPVSALVEAGQDAAAVVVGSRGRNALSRLLLGSVSHGVLQQLPTTVIVTRA
ncbi:universal stress protein [Canibacter zhoujuaniae]|uniref:universal stress protein n=1 Tax=Canibacter zhoujuaniae TaxID=2708343 RepID=UPI001420F507|nr:universal stress protein [Canibacter zhoujuaniae]